MDSGGRRVLGLTKALGYSLGRGDEGERPRVFLDIDIGGHRAAHAVATEFVAARWRSYGLSSCEIGKLGGSERARLAELAASEPAWAARGRLEPYPAPAERIIVALYASEAPTCAANFAALCTGEKGRSKGSGLPLHYRGSRFFRAAPGFIQGGDFSFSNGAGGESIWGGTFKDDKAALKLSHSRRGLLSMSNTGKNTNGSQFFITLAPLKHLDGRHCVFGEVVAGLEVLDAIAAVPVAAGEAPALPILIADCGRCDGGGV
jgi:cyclophilin family peptidyl-prolyl cis-trans isomerase